MSTNQNTSRQSDQNISEDDVLLLGKNFNVIGDLIGKGTIIVSGRVEGNISADKVISETGSTISGNIECAQLDLSGTLKGLIQATNIVIRNGALVQGEVQYTTLAMEQGCQVLGKLKKTSEKSPPPKAPPEKTAPITQIHPAVERTESILLNFPNELRVKLQDPAIRSKAALVLANGGAPPPWLALTNDKLGVLVNTNELQTLKDKNQSIQLRFNVGGDYFDFSLPS